MRTYRYFAFGEPLESDFPLPELAVLGNSGEGKPSISISLSEPSGFKGSDFETIVEWPAENGRTYCRLARYDDAFWLNFPGHAGFLLQAPGTVTCLPEPGCDERLLRHFLLNQAIPRFLGQLGRVVLHAGAVVLRDGPAVLFCGASGRGKSTLVSAYVKAGHELLADDCVALRMESGQVGVYGGTTLVRLRLSDVEAQLGVDSAFGPPDAYSGKRQAPLGRVNDGHSGQGAPLAAVFLLDPPAKRVEVETVPGATALVELLTSVYSLEHREEQQTVGAFQRVGEILESGLPVFRLAYPRSLELLPEVMATVEVTVKKKCARTVTKRRVPPEI